MKALTLAAASFLTGWLLLTGLVPSREKLPVHFALVQPADSATVDLDAGCAVFTGYVAQSRAYFQSQGVDFTPEVRCIVSTHTYAEIGQPDACGEGLNGDKVRSLIAQGELGWAQPERNKTADRIGLIVEGGGGYAGNIDQFSGAQNVGLAITGDRGLIPDVTGQPDPCGGFTYGGFPTLCHELLHAFAVDADTAPAMFCTEPLDAARLKQLKSAVNRSWLR